MSRSACSIDCLGHNRHALLTDSGFCMHKLIQYCSMGVPLALRNDEGSLIDDDDSQVGVISTGMAAVDADRSKKRKR